MTSRIRRLYDHSDQEVIRQGSGGYIFYANIEPSRFSNQWLDLGIGKSGVRQFVLLLSLLLEIAI